MADNVPVSGDVQAARAGLAAVDEARWAAVESVRRPMWIAVVMSLAAGATFGFGQLDTVFGWVAAAVFFTVFIAVGVIDAPRARRRGRLIDGRSMGFSFLWIAIIGMIIASLRSIELPAEQQVWIAIVAGVLLTAVTYAFLWWDETTMSRRLASGDFDPYTLFHMP